MSRLVSLLLAVLLGAVLLFASVPTKAEAKPLVFNGLELADMTPEKELETRNRLFLNNWLWSAPLHRQMALKNSPGKKLLQQARRHAQPHPPRGTAASPFTTVLPALLEVPEDAEA